MITSDRPGSEEGDSGAGLAGIGPVGLGLAGAALASAAWAALAVTTGLTFHLMPMSGGLAAAAAIVWRGWRASPAQRWLGVGLGGIASTFTALALGALAYPLDEWWVTVATALAGVAIGTAWLWIRSRG